MFLYNILYIVYCILYNYAGKLVVSLLLRVGGLCHRQLFQVDAWSAVAFMIRIPLHRKAVKGVTLTGVGV